MCAAAGPFKCRSYSPVASIAIALPRNIALDRQGDGREIHLHVKGTIAVREVDSANWDVLMPSISAPTVLLGVSFILLAACASKRAKQSTVEGTPAHELLSQEERTPFTAHSPDTRTQ